MSATSGRNSFAIGDLEEELLDEGDVIELDLDASGVPQLVEQDGVQGMVVKRLVNFKVRASESVFLPLDTNCPMTAQIYERPYTLGRLLRMEKRGKLHLPMRMYHNGPDSLSSPEKIPPIVTLVACGEPESNFVVTRNGELLRLPLDLPGKVTLRKELAMDDVKAVLPKMASFVHHDHMRCLTIKGTIKRTESLSRLGVTAKNATELERNLRALYSVSESSDDDDDDNNEGSDIDSEFDDCDADDDPAYSSIKRTRSTTRRRRGTSRRRSRMSSGSSTGESASLWIYKYQQLERELEEVRQELREVLEGEETALKGRSGRQSSSYYSRSKGRKSLRTSSEEKSGKVARENVLPTLPEKARNSSPPDVSPRYSPAPGSSPRVSPVPARPAKPPSVPERPTKLSSVPAENSRLSPAPDVALRSPSSPDSSLRASPTPGAGSTGASLRIPKNLGELQVSGVSQWLHMNQLGQYAMAFAKGGVDGKLLPFLTEDMLKDELGVHDKLHCLKITRMIELSSKGKK